MAETDVTRKLAAVLYADVAGYSRLTGADEEATHRALAASLDAITVAIEAHGGRVLHYAGDAILAEFASAVVAVTCAVGIQRDLEGRNQDLPEDRKLQFRIGVNLGDVIVDRGELYGDGVNVAARLEGLADPGGICISQKVLHEVRDKLEAGYEFLGDQQVKNIKEPVPVYKLRMDPEAVGKVIGEGPNRRRAGLLIGVSAVAIVLAIAVAWRPWEPRVVPTVAKSEAGSLTDKPAIVVLPFDNMSSDKEQAYFSDGMTEDLITDLSKVSGLLVVARHSAFAYKGQSQDIRTIAKELNVRYVVEGSVRKVGGQVRINAQLIDARTGNHLWADRYDRDFADILALQDEVRSKILHALKVTLSPDERQRLARQSTTSPEAYDLYLRGVQQESYFTKDGNSESQQFFRQAIALDPGFALAYARLAQAYSLAAENRWARAPKDLMDKALTAARKSVELDDTLPQAHWSLGRIYSRSPFKNTDRALASLERAVALNPNYADGYAFLGSLLNYNGRAAEALGFVEKAMRINPRFPFWYLFTLGQAQFFLTRYDAAVETFKKTIERNPTVSWPHRYLVSAYGHLGMRDEAEWELSELEALGRPLTITSKRENTPIQDPAYLKTFLEGFRKAGVPEE